MFVLLKMRTRGQILGKISLKVIRVTFYSNMRSMIRGRILKDMKERGDPNFWWKRRKRGRHTTKGEEDF